MGCPLTAQTGKGPRPWRLTPLLQQHNTVPTQPEMSEQVYRAEFMVSSVFVTKIRVIISNFSQLPVQRCICLFLIFMPNNYMS